MTPLSESSADRIAKLIRMLSSDNDGVVVATVHAFQKALRNAGTDVHEIARLIEEGSRSGADNRRSYEAGLAEGRRQASAKAAEHSKFKTDDGEPDWHEISRWCQARADRLREDKEREFVGDMVDRTEFGSFTPSEKQASWLLDIFRRLGAGRG
jgi:hypothetical protein